MAPYLIFCHEYRSRDFAVSKKDDFWTHLTENLDLHIMHILISSAFHTKKGNFIEIMFYYSNETAQMIL